MAPNFVAKTTGASSSCLSLGGVAVVERFAELRDSIVALVGREAAALLAEPVLRRRDDLVEIAWYTDQAGEPIPFAALDADLRRTIAGKLTARLGTLAPLLADPSVGPLLRRALYLSDDSGILAVGHEPVLIRWGMLPEGLLAEDDAAVAEHFAATLGPFAPFDAPRIADATPGATPSTPAVTDPISPMTTPARPRQARFRDVATGRGLVIATVIAALTALALTLPGILASPAAVSKGNSEDTLGALRQITKAMQDKVAAARAALAAAECTPAGAVDAKPGKDGQPPGPQLPPQPIPLRPQEGGVPSDMALVAERATQSVVFIFICEDRQSWEDKQKDEKEKDKRHPIDCPNPAAAPGAGGGSPAQLYLTTSGSGFFIGPKTIVTNMHVIKNAKAVFVTNRFLGRVHPATVTAATVKKSAADPDFAVLDIDVDHAPPNIALTTNVARLQNVVAAGYPGVITENDAQLDRLIRGDPLAAPELTTFPGFVTLVMQEDSALPLIFSSAVIGHGNSGGPLLDLCARAVGINTLGWSGEAEDTGYKVNVAESAKGLMAFLDSHSVAYQKADDACGAAPRPAGSSPPTGAAPPSTTPPAGPAPPAPSNASPPNPPSKPSGAK